MDRKDKKKKRIAFINQRYGREVNGGSESYTMQMVQHLRSEYEVEVLTSKALTYDKWEDYYEVDVEEINGVKVRRFGVKWKRNRYVQRLLKILITRFGCNGLRMTALWNKALGPYVPDLVDYIEAHRNEYDVFIFVTYMYYPAVFGMEKVKDKAVFVPTAHDEYNIYFKIYEKMFHMPKKIVYLTEEEKAFVERQFYNEKVEHKVIGIGIDLPECVDAGRFRKKYGIEGEYIIYAGRVDEEKGCGEMFVFFQRYAEEKKRAANHNDKIENGDGNSGKGYQAIHLVVLGKKYMEIPDRPDIHYLGFVPDEDKYDGMAGAAVLWLPSRFESLSISVLEAMALGKPVVVNGKCSVLRGHCKRSGGGLWYEDYESFVGAMKTLEEAGYDSYCKRAKAYVEKYYRWDKVTEAWKELLDSGVDGQKV